ncbi:MAG: OmpA family protein [Myxococcales bacterium]|nr:OmpA family protein [Myxococcales bacterium]
MKRHLLVVVALATLLAAQDSSARMSMRPLAPPPTAAPLGLTASDGTGLLLRRLDAKVVVRGPLAFTELTLAFYNPQNRQREGRFSIALPDGALVTRFAMKLASGWMEAEIVEREKARHVYEDYLHRRQDPALLEHSAGNSFSARVFPIFGRSVKQLKISYSQRLDAARPYRLRLRGLPRVDRLRVEGIVFQRDGKRSRKVLARSRVKPSVDFELPSSTLAGLRNGRLAVARVQPVIETRPAPLGSSLLVLVDSSASRALGFDAQIDATLALLRSLATSQPQGTTTTRLEVAAFDQETATIYRGELADMADKGSRAAQAIRAALRKRRALGASSLASAVAYVARRRPSRVLLVGDGVVTAGVEVADLRSRLGRLASTTRRMDVLAVGGIRDRALLRKLVAGALPDAGVVLDAERASAAQAARALRQRVATDLRLSVPGARFVWPRRVAALAAGEPLVVHAELATAASRTLKVVVRGKSTSQRLVVPLAAAPQALVSHALVRARVASLEQAPAGERAQDAVKRREALVKLSLAERVLCQHTALLVLESEWDYKRYGLSRDKAPGVLVLGRGGVVERRGVARHVLKVKVKAKVARVQVRARVRARRRAPGVSRERSGARVRVRLAKRAVGPDRDHDGIPDAVDKCPNEPETFNGLQDDDGCPDRGRVVVHMGRIEILDKIYFASGSSAIKTVSTPILDAVAATLKGNPRINLIEIQGHTDSRGSARANLRMSWARARAVRRYLIGKGVAGSRLKARGYGETRPVDGGQSAEAHSRNRRVEFVILARDNKPLRQQRLTRAQIRRMARAAAAERRRREVAERLARAQARRERERQKRFLDLWHASKSNAPAQQLADALVWRDTAPGNTLALVALGRAAQRAGKHALAARAYGSLIDLYASRADMRRFAGGLLAQLVDSDSEHTHRALRALSIDTLQRAVAQRPDHQSAHHQLTWALVRAGRLDAALAAAERGLRQRYRRTRPQAIRVLRADAAQVASLIASRDPKRTNALQRRLVAHGASISRTASTRFVLTWETDANDVDLHVRDAAGGHAYYHHRQLPSGGELRADVTNGYGPEEFAVSGVARQGALPYALSAHYYRRGPMGYGMGSLRIIHFDGANVRVQERPFVALRDGETVQLGSYGARTRRVP